MEDFGARRGTPKHFCIEEAQTCDLFIGLIGHLYGFVPEGDDTSITEQEYEAARAAERDMLLFVAPSDFKVPVDLILEDTAPRKQKTFREHVLKGTVANVGWSSPEQLAAGVVEAVRNWERARLGSSSPSLPLVPGIDLEKYAQRCRKRWEAIDLTALAAPGALDSEVDAPKLSQVFIPQACRRSRPAMSLPRDYLQKQGLDPDEEERLLSELQARWERQERLSTLDLLARNEVRKLVLLGDPGAGKSSLTRFVLLQLLDPLADPESAHGDWHRALNGHWPVLIELRDLLAREAEGRCNDLVSYLGYVGETQGFGFNRAAVEAQLRDRPSVIIVDGLDEIFDVKRRRGVVEEVIGLETRFPKARVLVTSRIAAFNAKPFEAAGFEIATLDDLDQHQIEVFADKWFSLAFPGETEKAAQARGDLLDTLKRRPQLGAIAGNPLILTIMAIIARHKRLARSRTHLYEQALEVLCYAWDYRRGLALSAESPLVDLQPDDTLLLLRRIAWRMQESKDGLRGNAISEADLRGILVDFFEHDWRFPPPKARRAAKEMLGLLQERNWILTTRGPDLYGFVHRTFLEYLCALELTKRFEAQELTTVGLRDTHVLPRVDDDSYSEVIRLLCGQLPPRVTEQLIIAICPPTPAEELQDGRMLLAWQAVGEIDPRVLASVEPACSRVLSTLHWWLLHPIGESRVQASEIADGISSIEPGSWPRGAMKNYQFPFSPGEFENIKILKALSRTIWSPQPDLHSRLFDLAKSKSWIRRRGALIALSGLSETPAIYELLCKAVRTDEDRRVRFAAVGALDSNYSTFPDSFDLLMAATEDPETVVRGRAVQVLAQRFANRSETVQRVATLATVDSENFVRVVAINTLASHLASHPGTYGVLLTLAEHLELRASAIRGLSEGFADRPEIYDMLKEWTESRHDQVVRMAALQGLVSSFGKRPEVFRLMRVTAEEDADATMRAAAVDALSGLPDRHQALDVIRRRAHSDDNEAVRRAATLAYARHLLPSILGRLLTRDLDGMHPGIEPREPITLAHVREAAATLGSAEVDIRRKYEGLIHEHGLPLELDWTHGPRR